MKLARHDDVAGFQHGPEMSGDDRGVDDRLEGGYYLMPPATQDTYRFFGLNVPINSFRIGHIFEHDFANLEWTLSKS